MHSCYHVELKKNCTHLREYGSHNLEKCFQYLFHPFNKSSRAKQVLFNKHTEDEIKHFNDGFKGKDSNRDLIVIFLYMIPKNYIFDDVPVVTW